MVSSSGEKKNKRATCNKYVFFFLNGNANGVLGLRAKSMLSSHTHTQKKNSSHLREILHLKYWFFFYSQF